MTANKLTQFISNMQQVSSTEIFIAIVSVVVAVSIGKLLCKIVEKNCGKNFLLSFLQSIKTLILPVIMFVFLVISIFVLKSITDLDTKPFLIFFLLRIALAWLAIAVSMLFLTKKIAGWFIIIFIIPITVLGFFGLWDLFADYLDSFAFTFGKVTISLYQALKTIFVIILLLRLASFLTKFSESRLKKLDSIQSSSRILIIKIVQIGVYFIIFLVTLDLLGINITTLAVFSGAIGVGLGFGLQKVTSNFISGMILLLERSIKIDDLVELSDGTTGFIRHTGARYTLVETSAGKDILVPNEDFITQRVVNWTYSNTRARAEIKVGVSYESDLVLAKKLTIEAAVEHPRCSKKPVPVCFLREFGESSVNFLLQFWVEDVVEGLYGPQSDIMFAILQKFKENNIEMPFPQRDLHIKSAANFSNKS
jgi:small-conductance mechanosensitive channel